MDKKTLRSQTKGILSELSKPVYDDYSYKIAERLFVDPDWQQAHLIGVTISKQPEVDTYQIIRKAWELGKKVAAPKCHPKEKKLTFHIITDFSQLESVFYGLLEPKEELTEEVKSQQIDLLLVPGLAFTKEGYRLGFGGGYYDRYLKNFPGKTISLAFSPQIIPSFHVEKHDIPVSKIITNEGVIQVK